MASNGALGIGIALSLFMAMVNGKGTSAVSWLLAILVGGPIFYGLVVAQAALSTVGKWMLMAAFVFVVSGLFFLW